MADTIGFKFNNTEVKVEVNDVLYFTLMKLHLRGKDYKNLLAKAHYANKHGITSFIEDKDDTIITDIAEVLRQHATYEKALKDFWKQEQKDKVITKERQRELLKVFVGV